MVDFLIFVKNCFVGISDMLDNVLFSAGGIQVSYLAIVVGAIGLSMVISIFWKGAQG